MADKISFPCFIVSENITMVCFMDECNIFDMYTNYYWRRFRRNVHPFCFMVPSFLRMESTLQFYLFVQFVAVFAKFRYNTYPTPSSSVATLYVPTVNPLMETCFLKPDPGPCRANMKMYYFDPSTNNCTSFKWGGCQGNGNRFETRSICKETCYMPPNMQPSRPRYCKLSFDYGFCFGALKRWYYDKNWKVCKETIYSGCGGNKNNFYNFEQCDTMCRLGNRPLPKPTTKKRNTDIRKIIIVNPPYATSPKTVKIYDSTKTKKAYGTIYSNNSNAITKTISQKP